MPPQVKALCWGGGGSATADRVRVKVAPEAALVLSTLTEPFSMLLLDEPPEAFFLSFTGGYA